MRIGIFGGSFNPVHLGHLHLARQAREQLGLDRVIFVPTRLTPGKPGRLLPPRLRLALLRAALKPYPAFRVSECEIRRKGLSYTVDTLRYFRRRLGRRAVLYLILGDDAAAGFRRWKSPRSILKMCHLVSGTRPGSRTGGLPPEAIRLSMPPVDVSASRIRRRISSGRSAAGWLPSGVERGLVRWVRQQKEIRSSRSVTARSS